MRCDACGRAIAPRNDRRTYRSLKFVTYCLRRECQREYELFDAQASEVSV